MAVSLVQGASRGLGLQFCKHLLASPYMSAVIATCRSPESATELQQLKSDHRNSLIVEKLDVRNVDDMMSVSENVRNKFGGLDLLINSAGILHPAGKGETSLKDVLFEDLQLTMGTNAFGPLLMGKYFSTLLQNGRGLIGHSDKGHKGVMVNISARVGSIQDNALGGWYGYRLSKAALNMATKTLSIELGRGRNKVICVSLHPGTVNTELSRRYHKGVPKDKLFSAEHSVALLMDVINTLQVKDSGKFFDYARKEIPF
ncbi:C-signal-like isoform X2 [Liolophura sinensis]